MQRSHDDGTPRLTAGVTWLCVQASDRVAAVAAGVDELAGLEHYIRTTKPGRPQATFLTVSCPLQHMGFRTSSGLACALQTTQRCSYARQPAWFVCQSHPCMPPWTSERSLCLAQASSRAKQPGRALSRTKVLACEARLWLQRSDVHAAEAPGVLQEEIMRELLARLNFMGFEFHPTPAVRSWL